MEIDRGNNLAKYYLIHIYNNTTQLDKVIILSDQLIGKYPYYLQAYLYKGYAAIKVKDYRSTINSLETVLRLSPPSWSRREEVEANLAEAYFLNQDYKMASSLYEKLYKKTDKPIFLYMAAMSFKKWDNIDEAWLLLSKLTQLSNVPETLIVRGYLELGRISVLKRDIQNTIYYYIKALRFEHNNLESLKAVAHSYFSLEDFEKALLYAKKLVRFEETPVVYLLIGSCEENLKNLGEALRAYKKAVVLMEKELPATTFSEKGICTIQLGAYSNFEKALKHYQKVKDLPDSRVEKIGGYYKLRIGKFKNPSECSDLLSKVKPFYTDAFIRKDYYIEDRMVVPKEETTPSSTEKQKPHQQFEKKPLQKIEGRESVKDKLADIYKRIGMVYYQMEDYSQALKSFNQALHLSTSLYQKDRFDEETAILYISVLSQMLRWDQVIEEGEILLKRKNISSDFVKKIKVELLYAYKNLGFNEKYFSLSLELSQKTFDPKLILETAIAAQKTEQLESSIKFYKEYLHNNFEPGVALNLYYILKYLKRYEECEELLKKIVQLESIDHTLAIQSHYEQAQIYRLTDRHDLYVEKMKFLLEKFPTTSFYYELADAMVASGQKEKAIEMYKLSLEKKTIETQEGCKIYSKIAHLYLDLKEQNKALLWLEKVKDVCPEDIDWKIGMALGSYQIGDYEKAIDILLSLPEDTPAFHLYLAFSFYKMGKPGLALYHMEKVDPKNLTPEELYNYYANKTYLLYDQGRFKEVIKNAQAALNLKDEKDIEVLKIKAMAEIECSEDVFTEAQQFFEKDHPDLLLAEIEKVIGICYLSKNQNREAITWFTRSLTHNPNDITLYYIRGLALFRDNQFKAAEGDFLNYMEHNPNPSLVFYRDFGILEGYLKKYKEGIEAFEKELRHYLADLNTVRNAGYHYMKSSLNEGAKDKFAKAIDIYHDKLPYRDEEDFKKEYEEMLDMKREYTKLDKIWGGEFYIGKTDLVSKGESSLFGGAIPSEFGAQVSYRLPRIGFRNEKTLDIFVRLLGNFKENSWSPDKDSYQLGLGIMYKPFIKHNYITSFERLIKIGNRAEDNWLWRNRLSLDWNQPPKSGRDIWLSRRLYGEASYFIEHPSRWVFYGDAKLGITWSPQERLWITPQLIGDYRYETNKNPLGCYREIGIGFNAKILESEKKYTLGRWYIEGFVYYKWGRFVYLPAGMVDKNFEGFIVGISFSK